MRCVLINTNDLVKIKIKYPSKPKIWETSHFYLCWNKILSTNCFLICTSNGFNLWANNTCGINDYIEINNNYNLPFNKKTYLITSESFNIDNIQEPKSYYKKQNAFAHREFNIYSSKALKATSINIKNKDCILLLR